MVVEEEEDTTAAAAAVVVDVADVDVNATTPNVSLLDVVVVVGFATENSD